MVAAEAAHREVSELLLGRDLASGGAVCQSGIDERGDPSVDACDNVCALSRVSWHWGGWARGCGGVCGHGNRVPPGPPTDEREEIGNIAKVA